MEKIHRATLYHIQLPLVQAFRSSADAYATRETLLLRLEIGDIEVWSECVALPSPTYWYETVTTAWYILTEYLLPLAVQEDFESREALMARLARVRGHPMAKATIEMALWTYEAVKARMPLARYIGGEKERIPAGAVVGLVSEPKLLLKRVEKLVEAGYRRIKLKITPGQDVELVSLVRKAFPDIGLLVDANQAYTSEHIHILQLLDEYELLAIEEPLAPGTPLNVYADVQQHLNTPIMLDESVGTLEKAQQAIEMGACRALNLKAGRFGGIRNMLDVYTFAHEHGIALMHGGMLESGIGRAYNVALASLSGFTIPGDIAANAFYFREDVVEPPFTLDDEGMIAVPSDIGLGVVVAEDRIQRALFRTATFTAQGERYLS
ncbi:o-succinylbenzoate synthase [Ardenticatena maritima]|uniref:o-succinylbenzoate synthase n=1 Tax=Ardenticatena maritima TaxID=872965 RepID=UPI0009E99CC1|nr:o-succinylbenzoate synthase [Ardenticatena maritima]